MYCQSARARSFQTMLAADCQCPLHWKAFFVSYYSMQRQAQGERLERMSRPRAFHLLRAQSPGASLSRRLSSCRACIVSEGDTLMLQ